jgi:hypothetical protein
MSKRIALAAVLAVIVALAWRPVGRTDKAAPHVAATAAPSVQQVKTRVPVAQAPASHAPEVVSEWQQVLTGDIDALQFVKAVLPAAKAGDGRAAYYIAQILRSCYGEMQKSEVQLQQELTQWRPDLPQWTRDTYERDARRCFGLAKENPFGDMPETYDYWFAQAYAAGDPLAQEDKAADTVADIVADPRMTEAVRAEKVKIVQDNLRAVVESGDLDGLYHAGLLMASMHVSTDTMRGYSVALAACDLGYDCTAANPESLDHTCAQSGACPPGKSLSTELQQAMGPEQYAKLYARSQQVVEAVRAQDWNAVLANLTMD